MSINYSWTFGDGTTGSGITFSKKYQYAGSFPARLRKVSSWGETKSDIQYVDIITNIQIMQDFRESTIHGPLKLGDYSAGSNPILGCNYQWSLRGEQTVNRFYFELDPLIGACGGTVFCNASVENPTAPLDFYNDLNRSIKTITCPQNYCCYGFTAGPNIPGFYQRTECLVDGSGNLIDNFADCVTAVNASYPTYVPVFFDPPDEQNLINFMVIIGDSYKAFLRSPLLNKNGIVELISPRIKFPGTGQFVYGNKDSYELDSAAYTALYESLIGLTMIVKAVNYSTCPDYDPVGPTLAKYKITGYQKQFDGNVFVSPWDFVYNGDQILQYGEYLIHNPTINVDPNSLNPEIQNYVSQGEIDGHNFANYYEYINQFGHANKRNAIYFSAFANTLKSDPSGPYSGEYPLFARWHENEVPQKVANYLYNKDDIYVVNPIGEELSNEYVFTTHRIQSGNWQTPLSGNELTYRRKFVSLDLANSTNFRRERALAYFEKFNEALLSRGIRLNSGYTNIEVETNANEVKLRDVVLGTMPFVNDTVYWEGHNPPDGPPHQSINPWQAEDGPSEPESGFLGATGISSVFYPNYIRIGGTIINPRNQYLKNWLYAHANGSQTQKQAVYDLFSYAYATQVTAGNIIEYINKDFGMLTQDGSNPSWPSNNIFTGGTHFGWCGFNEQYYYGKIALDKLGNKLYSCVNDVITGNDSINGFNEFNLMNYTSYKCEPKGRTYGQTGSFDYDNSVFIDIFNKPAPSGEALSDVDVIQWYGNVPSTTENTRIITGSFIQERLADRWGTKNYIRYPFPHLGFLQQGYTLYDNLAQKTFPFWTIVWSMNNMRALWRSHPDRKKVAWLSPFSEQSSKLRDRFYRVEYNIHGILSSSTDVQIPLFAPSNGAGSYENSVLNAFREVNKVLQHNRRRLLYLENPYDMKYMSPQYLNKSNDGKTYTNLLNIPPLVTGVEFGGKTGDATYPYVAYRITLPLPTNFSVNITGEGVNGNNVYKVVSGGAEVDFGATLAAAETYPNLPPPFKVGITFGDNTTGVYSPGLTRPAGLWFLGYNNSKFRNMQFSLTSGICGATGACCGPTGTICLGITTIDNCSALGGFFKKGLTCSACT